jgi:hypothetical protein
MVLLLCVLFIGIIVYGFVIVCIVYRYYCLWFCYCVYCLSVLLSMVLLLCVLFIGIIVYGFVIVCIVYRYYCLCYCLSVLLFMVLFIGIIVSIVRFMVLLLCVYYHFRLFSSQSRLVFVHKSGSLRFSQFSGCWLILSVYEFLLSLCKIVRSSVILLLPFITNHNFSQE